MKYIILLLTLLLISCNQNSTHKNNDVVSAAAITDSAKCDNCGKNLIKYISTNYTVKTNGDGVHHFCSMNCLVKDFGNAKIDTNSIYVIDVKSKEFIPAKDAYYVVRSGSNGITAYAYKEFEYAKRFNKDFNGWGVINFKKALETVKDN